MAKHRIRITGSGIHGAPTADNPTGEIAIGTEFDTDADLPAGWVGRAVIVGEEPKEGSVFVTGNGGEGGDLIDAARKEVIEKAEAEFKRMDDKHRADMLVLVERAEKAESNLQAARDQISTLNLKLAAFDHDGNGSAGGSGQGEGATADEIKTAVSMLDGKTDTHWTAAGLPAVDAVAEITGKHVTRAAINEASPDAKRPA